MNSLISSFIVGVLGCIGFTIFNFVVVLPVGFAVIWFTESLEIAKHAVLHETGVLIAAGWFILSTLLAIMSVISGFGLIIKFLLGI